MNNTNTVLITGGAGYIGSACTQALCGEGHNVVVFDNLSNGDEKYVDERAIFIEGDVLDKKLLAQAFTEHQPAIVIHAAALKAVSESEEQPERYFENNVSGSINVLQAAGTHGVEHIIFSSTAAVYRPSGSGIYRETDELGAVSVYGNSKQIVEKLITEFTRTGRVPRYTIFRYFNVAGDTGLGFTEKSPQNLFPLLARATTNGEELKIFGTDYSTPDGTGVRDYIHISDLVDAHLRVIGQNAQGIFNLGTGKGYSVLELVDAFKSASGTNVPYKSTSRRSGDPAIAVAVAKKAHDELGWELRHTLENMVRSTLDAYSS